MNITCPHCGARYRLDDEKVPDEGLRIKCPKCTEFFRVMSPRSKNPLADKSGAPGSAPTGFAEWDFLDVLLSWKVRKTDGSAVSFRKLAQLEGFIERGLVLQDDVVSFDSTTWIRLGDIDDRAAWFHDMWQKADREEISSLQSDSKANGEGEDIEDQPTGMFNMDAWVRTDDDPSVDGVAHLEDES